MLKNDGISNPYISLFKLPSIVIYFHFTVKSLSSLWLAMTTMLAPSALPCPLPSLSLCPPVSRVLPRRHPLHCIFIACTSITLIWTTPNFWELISEYSLTFFFRLWVAVGGVSFILGDFFHELWSDFLSFHCMFWWLRVTVLKKRRKSQNYSVREREKKREREKEREREKRKEKKRKKKRLSNWYIGKIKPSIRPIPQCFKSYHCAHLFFLFYEGTWQQLWRASEYTSSDSLRLILLPDFLFTWGIKECDISLLISQILYQRHVFNPYMEKMGKKYLFIKEESAG